MCYTVFLETNRGAKYMKLTHKHTLAASYLGYITQAVVNNLTPQAVIESTKALASAIRASQIVMIPGGFSGGDEPEGSGKFIATTFRNPKVAQAVTDLLETRDGLMLGICNGFQALIKLGLVPYGKITEPKEDDPTLTFNTLGRHVSRMVYTRVPMAQSAATSSGTPTALCAALRASPAPMAVCWARWATPSGRAKTCIRMFPARRTSGCSKAA